MPTKDTKWGKQAFRRKVEARKGTNKIWKHKVAEPVLAHELLNKGGEWFYFAPFAPFVSFVSFVDDCFFQSKR